MIGLAQLVEGLIAQREVAGSIPRAGPILSLKLTEKRRYFLCTTKRLDLRVARMTMN